ncbi:MAG: trypsin-like peptidase domain-containing protein, partial [Nitrospira sp.]
MPFRLLSSVLAALVLWASTAFGQPAPAVLQTTSFNQQWLDTVVSIEVTDSQKELQSIGTGFLVRTANKHIVLVTAQHVIQGPFPAGSRLAYRLNSQGGGSAIVWDDELPKGLASWFNAPASDVACRFIAWPDSATLVTLTPDNFIADGALSAGAPVLVLGFPLGLRSADHPRPIARHGIVGRVDHDNVIADVFVFPGNSGGPVIYNPSLKVGQGLNSPLLNAEKLIGVVSSFLPYRETAISLQTQRPRVVFEENSGLSNVVPVNRLVELLASDSVKKMDA